MSQEIVSKRPHTSPECHCRGCAEFDHPTMGVVASRKLTKEEIEAFIAHMGQEFRNQIERTLRDLVVFF